MLPQTRSLDPKLLIVILIFIQQAAADDLGVVRPSVEYEQCSNAAQVEYDKDTTDCFNDLERAASKEENPLQQCIVAADKKLKKALKKCPTETPREKSRD